MRRALEGVKILDASQGAAGPYAPHLLGSLGADVIKLESPTGEIGRIILTTHYKDISYSFAGLNLNKKGITLNLKSDKGKEIFKELIQHVDVMVENFTPGTMEEWGLDYEELAKINPRLIYASVSGFGRGSIYEHLPALDLVMQAMGGAMPSCGLPETPPLKAGVMYLDAVTPTHLAVGILAALYDREHTGKGQWVQVAMRDVAAAINNDLYNIYYESARPPARMGNRVVGLAPVNLYQTTDGYIAIAAASDSMADGVLKAIGRQDLLGTEKYNSRPNRWRNRAELDAMIEEWTKSRTKKEAFDGISAEDVPCAMVLNAAEMLNDTDLANRGQIVEIEQPGIGKVKFALSPIRLSGAPPALKPAPLIGQHNQEVYQELLGYTPQHLEQLKQEGIL